MVNELDWGTNTGVGSFGTCGCVCICDCLCMCPAGDTMNDLTWEAQQHGQIYEANTEMHWVAIH